MMRPAVYPSKAVGKDGCDGKRYGESVKSVELMLRVLVYKESSFEIGKPGCHLGDACTK